MLEQRTRVVRFALQNGNRSVLREGSSAASREQGSKKNGSRPLHSQGNGQKLRQPLILDSTPAWNVALGPFRPQAQYRAVAWAKNAWCSGRCLMGNATASVFPRTSAVAAALLLSTVE